MSRTFTSFKYHNYRIWWLSNIFASTATWMQRVAQDWVVLMVLTDQSGFAVGVVTALQFLPHCCCRYRRGWWLTASIGAVLFRSANA
ncbi:MAG: hypothetical protein ACLS7Q_05435 [Varibaculum cambriense]